MCKLVEHHVKYKEIHGVDETVWLSHGEHQKLHHRLRMEGKCNVPVDELEKISKKAYQRTQRGGESQLKHKKGKRCLDYNKLYKKNNTHTFNFSQTLMPNVEMNDNWYYNKITDVLIISSGFRADHGKKILYIGEGE